MILIKRNRAMKKYQIEIKWALLFSVMGLVWMLLEKVSGLHDRYLDYQLYLTNIFAIPAIWLFVLAFKDKKNNFYNGRIRYLQGVKTGLIMTVLIAMLSPLTQWVTSEIITPNYFANVIVRSVELGYYPDTAAAEAQFNYPSFAKQGVIGALIMGVITTLIVMIFVRTKEVK